MASATRAASVGRAEPSSARATHSLAPMNLRVVGAAIDFGLLIVVAGLLSSWLSQRFGGVVQIRFDSAGGREAVEPFVLPGWTPALLMVTLSALYTIPLMAVWGRTIGGWCVGIRCVRIDSGRALGWSSSARRWVLLYGVAGSLALLPLLGALTWVVTLVIGLSPLWDSTRRLRGYADHWADDVVVRAPWHG